MHLSAFHPKTWDWKIWQTVTFWFLNIARRPTHHTKWPSPYLLEPFSSRLHVWLCRHQLSYCHAWRGRTRQFQVIRVRSPLLLDRVFVLIHLLNGNSPRHARKRKEPGRMPYSKEKGHVFFPHFPRQNVNCYSQDHRWYCEYRLPDKNPWIFHIETEEPCKQQVGSFDEALWRMTHIRAAIICSKPCDSIAEDAFSVVSVSIPAPCFFDQQAVHDKNSKGDIPGFPNWDWKIWKQSLSMCEHCKKTPHHRTTWPSPVFLNLSRASCMFGHV